MANISDRLTGPRTDDLQVGLRQRRPGWEAVENVLGLLELPLPRVMRGDAAGMHTPSAGVHPFWVVRKMDPFPYPTRTFGGVRQPFGRSKNQACLEHWSNRNHTREWDANCPCRFR